MSISVWQHGVLYENINVYQNFFKLINDLMAERVVKCSLTWSIFWRDLSESPANTDSYCPLVASDEVNEAVLLTPPLITHWSSYFTFVSVAVETSHLRLKTLKSSVPFVVAFSFLTSWICGSFGKLGNSETTRVINVYIINTTNYVFYTKVWLPVCMCLISLPSGPGYVCGSRVPPLCSGDLDIFQW